MPTARTRYVLRVSDPVAAEVAIAALWTAGAAGVWDRGPADGPELVAWFESADAPVPPGGRWEEEPDDDWLTAWREGLEPVRVGALVVAAPWHAPTDAARVIVIDPRMAFGTGHHPTTRLCLAAIQELVGGGGTVLDVGTGSGVLAIAAALLGAERVLAVDTDPEATAEARRNVRENLGIDGDRVEVLTGSLTDVVDGAAFDLVVANLVTAAVADLAGELVSVLRPGGHLVVSGVATERATAVIAALERAGAAPVSVRRERGWVAITAVGPSVTS
jgi:ribosomal protein L11 methyltransferase